MSSPITPAQRPGAIQHPTADQISAFLEIQKKDLELREKQLEAQKQVEKQTFEYSKKALEAQKTDRDSQRAYEIEKQRQTYVFVVVLFVCSLAFAAVAFYLGPAASVTEILKLLVVFASGAAGGYQYGKRSK